MTAGPRGVLAQAEPMYDDTTRGLESPVTADNSTSNCPGCDGPIQGITTTGPGEHYASPCGCTVGAHVASELGGGDTRAVADGGEPPEAVTNDEVAGRWATKAEENIEKWGLQRAETLLLAMGEEFGELSRAFLEARHEDGDPTLVGAELDDLGALCLQLDERLVDSEVCARAECPNGCGPLAVVERRGDEHDVVCPMCRYLAGSIPAVNEFEEADR